MPVTNLVIERRDFYGISLTDADVVICYLYSGAMERLREKFERRLFALTAEDEVGSQAAERKHTALGSEACEQRAHFDVAPLCAPHHAQWHQGFCDMVGIQAVSKVSVP